MKAKGAVLVCVVAFGAGVVGGFWWVSHIDAGKSRIRTVPAPVAPRWPAEATYREETDRGPVDNGVKAEGSSRDDQEVDGESEPTLLDLKSGGAGDLLLAEAEYEIGGASRDLVVESTGPTGERLRAQLKARAEANRNEYVRLLESHFALTQRLGDAPWENDRFQVLASVNAASSFAIVGSDWDLPASPELSLRWYVGSSNAEPDEATRNEILGRLRDYEVRRRQLLAEVVAAIQEGSTSREAEGSVIVAYAIMRGRLVLVSEDEVPEIRSMSEAGRGLEAGLLQAAEELLR